MQEEWWLGCGGNSGPPLKWVASQPSGLRLSYPYTHPLSVSIPVCARVCLCVLLVQSLRASSNVSSWRRARGAEHGEGLICATCNQSGHDCEEWKGRRGRHRLPQSCRSASLPRTGRLERPGQGCCCYCLASESGATAFLRSSFSAGVSLVFACFTPFRAT